MSSSVKYEKEHNDIYWASDPPYQSTIVTEEVLFYQNYLTIVTIIYFHKENMKTFRNGIANIEAQI